MHRSPTPRARVALRLSILAGILAVVAGACAGGASTAPTTPGSSPTAAPGALVLDRAPDSTACDAIGVDYTSMTFHVDPTASPQIWAVADTGTNLTVRWDSAFEAGTGAEPSVVDGSGAVVLEDGDTLAMPADGSYPDLGGHFVCTGPTGLIILDQAPA